MIGSFHLPTHRRAVHVYIYFFSYYFFFLGNEFWPNKTFSSSCTLKDLSKCNRVETKHIFTYSEVITSSKTKSDFPEEY